MYRFVSSLKIKRQASSTALPCVHLWAIYNSSMEHTHEYEQFFGWVCPVSVDLRVVLLCMCILCIIRSFWARFSLRMQSISWNETSSKWPVIRRLRYHTSLTQFQPANVLRLTQRHWTNRTVPTLKPSWFATLSFRRIFEVVFQPPPLVLALPKVTGWQGLSYGLFGVLLLKHPRKNLVKIIAWNLENTCASIFRFFLDAFSGLYAKYTKIHLPPGLLPLIRDLSRRKVSQNVFVISSTNLGWFWFCLADGADVKRNAVLCQFGNGLWPACVNVLEYNCWQRPGKKLWQVQMKVHASTCIYSRIRRLFRRQLPPTGTARMLRKPFPQILSSSLLLYMFYHACGPDRRRKHTQSVCRTNKHQPTQRNALQLNVIGNTIHTEWYIIRRWL